MNFTIKGFIPIMGLLFVSCSSEKVSESKIPSLTEEDIIAVPEVNSVPLINAVQCLPKNEANKDNDLYKLVLKLKRAILKRDTSMLFSIMDSSVVSSHGGGIFGYNGMVENWEHNMSAFWSQLGMIVAMGGAFQKDSLFKFPYGGTENYHDPNHFLNIDYPDPYVAFYCVTESVELYEYPDRTSKVVAKLKYSLVQRDYDSEMENKFWLVHVLGSKYKGFVHEDDLHRVGDYELSIVKKKSGEWKITGFSAYD